MPPKVGSRHIYSRIRADAEQRLVLTEREPYAYRELTDNREITALQGDTWFSLAARYFAPLPRACGFWWAICDFQPTPILDPTVPPVTGTTIVIPSIQTLRTRIFGESRRRDH